VAISDKVEQRYSKNAGFPHFFITFYKFEPSSNIMYYAVVLTYFSGPQWPIKKLIP